MIASACGLRRGGLWTLVLLSTASPTLRAETRAASQLTCLMESGELLASSAEPPAALASDGFDFERLASRRSGRESQLRLVSSAAGRGFLPGITSSAALRLDLGLDRLDRLESAVLRDAGSTLGAAWHGAGLVAGIVAYPFDTDYVRLGYLHALDWGGTNVEHGESIFVDQEGGAPGAELELQLPRVRIGAAAKWTRAHEGLRRERRRWGVAIRGSFEVGSALRLDAGFGYFERSAPRPLPSAASAGFVEGASARLVWHRGVTQPELAAEPFRPPNLRDESELLEAPAQPGFALAFEGVALVRRVRDLAAPERDRLSAAPAAAIYGSVRGRVFAAHTAVTWRSLGFVLRNSEGLLPGEGSPERAVARSELAAWVGVSATLRWHVVPSLELGCLLPAALQTASVLPGFSQTFVVRGPSQVVGLPLAADRLPVFAGRAGVRFEVTPSLELGLFGSYERDANRVRLLPSAGGAARAFATADSLRLLAAAWSRF